MQILKLEQAGDGPPRVSRLGTDVWGETGYLAPEETQVIHVEAAAGDFQAAIGDDSHDRLAPTLEFSFVDCETGAQTRITIGVPPDILRSLSASLAAMVEASQEAHPESWRVFDQEFAVGLRS